MIKEIKTKKQLIKLKKSLGVNDDWDGADDLGIDVTIIGHVLGDMNSPYNQYAKIRLKGKTLANITLSNLLAWSTKEET
jgi:hypothetical protein